MPKNSQKHRSVTLSVFSLPLLFVAALLLAAGTGLFTATQKQLSAKHVASSVLSDEDSKESDSNDNEDSKDDEDSHDNEDNNKENDNEDSNDDGMTEAQKKAAETAKKAAERAREQQKKQAELQKRVASPTLIAPHDNEDENEVENETEDNNEKVEVVSTVKNDDGTITRTIKKTEDDGKFEMKAITISLDGKVIKEVELNSDGTPKVDDENENEAENDAEDANENENETDSEKKDKNTGDLQPVVVGFPVEVKVNGANLSNPSVLNKIRVEINKQIKEMPDVEGKVSKVELEAQVENGEYKGLISKDERLFGLFTVSVPVEVTVDPNTGNVTVSDQTFWSKFLDALSF